MDTSIFFPYFPAGTLRLVGVVLFDFTLVNGWTAFTELLILSGFGPSIFLEFGFVVSRLAYTEQAVPPIANLFTLPQFLLSGVFFPIEIFPIWPQPLVRAKPLTYLTEAMRKHNLFV